MVDGDERSRTWWLAALRGLAAAGLTAVFLLLPAGAAAGQPAPDTALQPFLSCVTANQDGTVTARFGYRNDTGATVSIPPGDGNSIDPDTYLDRLPSEFAPGRNEQAFTVTFPGPDVVVWSLNGRTSSASAGSAACPAPAQPAASPTTVGGPSTTGGSPLATDPGPAPGATSAPAATAPGLATSAPARAPSDPPPRWSPPSTGPAVRGSGVGGTSVGAPERTRPRTARAASSTPVQGIASLDRSNAVPAVVAGLILLAIASAGVAAGRYRPGH